MRGLRKVVNHFRHAKSNMALVAGIFVFSMLAFGGFGLLGQDNNAHASASPDNDIVRGGIYNGDLASKCVGDVKTIMDHYRIDCNLAGVVDGRACRNGNVYVGNEVVASSSTSIGRLPISGSHPISIGGRTYYETPNSAGFLQECIDAFVKMDGNGGFVYAILKPCGNPVWTPAPKPPKPPTPPAPKNIKVCDLSTKKIITINEDDYDTEIHSKNLADCKEVKILKIQVCDLTTKTIVTINKDDYDSSKHSTNLADCKEVKIQVCDLTTKAIVTINEKDFTATKYSKTTADCKVVNIEVCELSTKKTITINEKDYDSSKHSKNLADCKQCVENPKAGVTCELPQTGITDNLMGAGFGVGSVIVAGSAYVASRKDLLSAFLNR